MPIPENAHKNDPFYVYEMRRSGVTPKPMNRQGWTHLTNGRKRHIPQGY